MYRARIGDASQVPDATLEGENSTRSIKAFWYFKA